MSLLLSFSLPSLGQTYKWMDEKGRVHLADDPSTIPEQYLPSIEKSRQDLLTIVSGRIKDDLKKTADQKLNQIIETANVLRVADQFEINKVKIDQINKRNEIDQRNQSNTVTRLTLRHNDSMT
jgi:hypothetical protein